MKQGSNCTTNRYTRRLVLLLCRQACTTNDDCAFAPVCGYCDQGTDQCVDQSSQPCGTQGNSACISGYCVQVSAKCLHVQASLSSASAMVSLWRKVPAQHPFMLLLLCVGMHSTRAAAYSCRCAQQIPTATASSATRAQMLDLQVFVVWQMKALPAARAGCRAPVNHRAQGTPREFAR